MKDLNATEVADALEAAVKGMTALAHDIRQRTSPGYSTSDTALSELEVARLKEIGDGLTGAMEQAYRKPAPSGPRPVDTPPANTPPAETTSTGTGQTSGDSSPAQNGGEPAKQDIQL